MRRLVLCFPFSLKTLLLYDKGGGTAFQPYPSLSLVGLATLPGSSVFSQGSNEREQGEGVPSAIGSCLPQGPLHSPGSLCKVSTLPPQPGPKGPSFSLLNGRRHYIESL